MNKEFIEKNLLTIKKGLHTAKLKKHNVKISNENIFLIYNNLKEPRRCKECNSYTSFIGFTAGYAVFCSNKCVRINKDIREKSSKKSKETCILRYGVEYVFQDKKFIEKAKENRDYEKIGNKIKETMSKKSIEDIKISNLKRRETKKKRYNDANFTNIPKRKKTCMLRYGYTSASKHHSVKAKTVKTNLERYGENHCKQSTEYWNQNSSIPYKHKKYNFLGTDIFLQGYEPFLLDELVLFYKEEEILFDKKDMPEVWYIGEDNKKHRYFPDIYLPFINTVFEVKSKYTLFADLEKNILKFNEVSKKYNFQLIVYNDKGERDIFAEQYVKEKINANLRAENFIGISSEEAWAKAKKDKKNKKRRKR